MVGEGEAGEKRNKEEEMGLERSNNQIFVGERALSYIINCWKQLASSHTKTRKRTGST